VIPVSFAVVAPVVAWLALQVSALTSVEEARKHQAMAADHILSYVEHREPDGLQKAKEDLARVYPWVVDRVGPDRLIAFPIQTERLFLRRVIAWFEGARQDMDWGEMPQFLALLTYLARDGCWLLRYHLAEVADAIHDDVGTARGRDDTTMLMIRTLRPERWDFEHKLALRFVGLRPGESIADLGSGSGFFTFRFSSVVGPTGHVFAIDVDQRHLDFIDANRDLMPYPNVTTSLSSRTRNNLPDASVDVVFISNILFDVERYGPRLKAEFYSSIRRILRPGGRFVACDHARTYGGLPIRQVVDLIRAAGFDVVASYDWPALCVKAVPR